MVLLFLVFKDLTITVGPLLPGLQWGVWVGYWAEQMNLTWWKRVECELSSGRLGVDGRAARISVKNREDNCNRGRRAALFDGGQETSRVMNFSAGCIRSVIRTRTGVRKQVVADICSAWGPGFPHQPLPHSLTELPSSYAPFPPLAVSYSPLPSSECYCLEPDCWIVSRCRRETENESETVFCFFLWSHI